MVRRRRNKEKQHAGHLPWSGCQSEKSSSPPQLLFRRRSLTGGTYGPWKETYRTSSPIRKSGECVLLDLSEGGQLCIFPNLLTNKQQDNIRSELLQCGYFRQYKVQNQNEPRAHFLLHADATEPSVDHNEGRYLENPELPQPGYKYNTVRMKARPLNHLPEVQVLATHLQNLAVLHFPSVNAEDIDTTTFWNIGVNPVLYRDGRDHMGFHADDDQGESLIFSVVVASPDGTTRKVRIQSKTKNEEIELYLDSSDGYSMDGTMQMHYLHSVPSDSRCKTSPLADSHSDNQRNTRIAVVFRRGNQVMQSKDSGRPCASLTPRPEVPYQFGRMDVLAEGATYLRQQLFELNAHRSQQRGVSGNREVGCDAIIVSGGRQDGLGCDGLFHLVYAASFREGAWSLLSSATTDKPIRVFRSSSFVTSVFRATQPGKQTVYRYDGLYRMEAVLYKSGSSSGDTKNTTNNGDSIYRVENIANHVSELKQNSPDRIYFFCLVRCSNDKRLETYCNRLSNSDLLEQATQAQTLSELACAAIQASPLQPQQRQSGKPQRHQCTLKDWQDYVLFKDWEPERGSGIDTMPEKLRCPDAKIPQHRMQGRRATWNLPFSLSPLEALAVQQLHMLLVDLGGASILRNLGENDSPSVVSVYQETNIPKALSSRTATASLTKARYCRNLCDKETMNQYQPRSGLRKGMKYLETIERIRAGCVNATSAAKTHNCTLNHRPTLLYHCNPENKFMGVQSGANVLNNEKSLVRARPKLRRSPRIHSSSLVSDSSVLNRKRKKVGTDSTKSLSRKEHALLCLEKVSTVPKKARRHTEVAARVEQQPRRRQNEMVPHGSAAQRLKLYLPILVRRSPRNHPSSLRSACKGAINQRPDTSRKVLVRKRSLEK